VSRIAIARCSKTHDYEESLRRAGGETTVLDYRTHPVADVVRQFDGVLLAGGADVLPSMYGEAAHPAFSAAEPGRDEYEIELVRRALEADLPLFAICRGIQVLNVALGGTLVQDIPTEVPNALPHVVREPRVAIAHDVWVTSGSLLERLMRERIEGGDELHVNSRHHQAVKQLGSGLVVAGTAPDGVIEAVEDPGRRFCLGVQWHPENFYRTGEFSPLFEGFVAAAGGERRGRSS
jgi:putative glutamine amidotransferase